MVLKTPRSQFFTIRADPRPANNLVIFFFALSNQFFFILSYLSAQTRCALQMQLNNRRCKEDFFHFNTAIKICFENKAFAFQLSCPIKSSFEKAFAL